MATIEITPKITALNEKANVICGWQSNDILTYISKLNTFREVNVGYRSSCGSTDSTMKVFALWAKTLKEIAKQGVIINAENIPQKNAYATIAGGFWHEFKYTMPPK